MKKTRLPIGLVAILALASLVLTACGSGHQASSAGPPTASVSSDLGKIAYVLDGSIYVKSLPEGQSRFVARGTSPKWSRDGDWLLLYRDAAYWEIREDGADEQQLPAEMADWGRDDDSTLSPDGNHSAYVLQIGDDSSPFGRYDQLRLVSRREGGWDEGRTLYESKDAGIIFAGWTADSRYVLFWNDSQFSASLMADGTTLEAIPVSGDEPRPLYSGLTRPVMFSPAPDGSRLAVTEGTGRESWAGKRIAVVDAATGNVTELTPSDMASIQPSWSPDGRRIAFSSEAANEQGFASGKTMAELSKDRRIWVMNDDGTAQRPLAGDPAYRDERPLWSGDGSQILFGRLDSEMQASLWLVPSSGGGPVRVVDALGPADILDYYGVVDWDSMFDWWQPA